MPCQDYRDNYHVVDNTETFKQMRDQLARIACKAMDELARADPENNLFKDKEAGPWYTQHKIDDAAAQAAERNRRDAERDRRAKATAAKEAKAAVLAKLTEEDKKILGIR